MGKLRSTSTSCSAGENQSSISVTADSRRKFLTGTTAVLGMAGASIASWPFLASLKPSNRAKVVGGPVRVDVSQIDYGKQVMVRWQGRPIWILRRTPAMLDRLSRPHLIDQLSDPQSEITSQQPEYVRNEFRSINPEVLVVVAICTHLGCVPLFRPDSLSESQDENWMGGYYCPCHKSKFDLAGRVFKSVPAPTNLEVPPHKYIGANTLVIGAENMGGVS